MGRLNIKQNIKLMYKNLNLKEATQVVIFNKDNYVLGVSRKTDHRDFGLAGGKVDDTDISREEACLRELKEETGIVLEKENLILVYSNHRDGYLGFTYLAIPKDGQLDDEFYSLLNINYDKEKEPHIVKWTSFEELINGSFGKWNNEVYQSLVNLGITNIK